jgi:hypothetical protein
LQQANSANHVFQHKKKIFATAHLGARAHGEGGHGLAGGEGRCNGRGHAQWLRGDAVRLTKGVTGLEDLATRTFY